MYRENFKIPNKNKVLSTTVKEFQLEKEKLATYIKESY